MKNRPVYENGFLIVEDYNFITYTKTNARKISWYAKNKKFNNFNIGTYLYKILKNYNVSFINKSKILKLIVENKFYEKIVKNVKLIIKSIIKLKNKVENVYLFIKFVSSKCILKMSTFYYLKYIIEQIYQKKLEKIVRVVLPISDLHKLYSYIYFQNFLITNYYEHILSKSILNELKITNNKNNNNTSININEFLKFCENSNTQNMNNWKELKQEEKVNDSYIKINTKTKHILKCVKIDKGRCRNKYKKQTDIKIEKYKIQKTVYKSLNKNDIGLFAGTFDKIHMGHTLLLFYSILLTNKFFYIGLYNNKNIYKKKYCEEIDDLKLRIFHIYDILFLISNAYNIQFIFYNFDSVIPFIKIKNSHTILYQIAMKNNKNKLKEISESYRDKYRKYISNSYYRNCSKYNQRKNIFFVSKYTNLLKKKYQSLIKTNIEKLYQNEKWRGNKLLCSNKYKKKIWNYLKFHINYNKNKSEKKIIVLKRIHDPFSFALDIRDLFCLTMSKESEVNGYNIVQRRKLLFQKNKTNFTKNEQIEHNFQIVIDDNNNNRNKGNDIEKIKTCLNIFDTINISNREKMSSTLIRMENSIFRKGKFSKYLKYFIEACLYFNIDNFLIQMHADIFLKKDGKKNFKNLYLNTIKSYFCRRKKNNSNKNGINKNVKGKNFHQNKKNDNFIVNDFFRHLFVLISFFINHFSKKYYTQNKIQFFIRISIIVSFFFYNNILLQITKKKEQFINKNFIINNKSIKQKNCLFDANYEDIFRIYISNMTETIMEEIVNQVFILILMILSTSIICKMFHFDLFPNVNYQKNNSSKNMTNLQKVYDWAMMKKKKHLPCYQIKQNIKNDKDILYDSKKKTEKNAHYNILEDEQSTFKKYYFNLYFSNYFKTKKTFYRTSIITPYTMCNYTLMRTYKNKNYNMLPYQYCKCVKKGIQKKGNSLYSNIKNNTSNNNKLVNDVNSDNIKKKNIFAHNFHFDYSNKKDIQIINNFYTIKIRENGEEFNDQNKLSENDIIKHVTKNTLSGNIYSERFNYFIKININNNDKIMFFRKILIYKFIDNYFISFFSFYFLNYLINEENKTKQNIQNMNINDFVFIFLIHFETHIEMIINSYIKRQWELRQKNYYDPFYPFIQYQKKYSIIHKYMHMNLSPLNDYNIDFEKVYNFKKNNTNFKNTPFYIKLENMKDTSNYNVLSFYNIIFQHILTYENYYYPYFAALNYLHLNLF
ncbi:phosphopantetheine adenylyltransferase, putative [Plasmodium berghei]|uniref:Phosphopantetheine adenylyltransferase, putative n=1 Tax=Plasmodium berghei TaxID=5821 RepID=A0A1D3S7I4_PLABE|nr:phosphopantetheine adenylyltransferase, putative [Plasmodium berghei]